MPLPQSLQFLHDLKDFPPNRLALAIAGLDAFVDARGGANDSALAIAREEIVCRLPDIGFANHTAATNHRRAAAFTAKMLMTELLD